MLHMFESFGATQSTDVRKVDRSAYCPGTYNL